jgi:hypothetical protein
VSPGEAIKLLDDASKTTAPQDPVRPSSWRFPRVLRPSFLRFCFILRSILGHNVSSCPYGCTSTTQQLLGDIVQAVKHMLKPTTLCSRWEERLFFLLRRGFSPSASVETGGEHWPTHSRCGVGELRSSGRRKSTVRKQRKEMKAPRRRRLELPTPPTAIGSALLSPLQCNPRCPYEASLKKLRRPLFSLSFSSLLGHALLLIFIRATRI